MSDWRPIETAPLDGEMVIICDCFGSVPSRYRARMTREEWIQDIADVSDEVAEESYEEYCAGHPEGWTTFDEDEVGFVENPTHWMPMPTPPGRASQ